LGGPLHPPRCRQISTQVRLRALASPAGKPHHRARRLAARKGRM